MSNYTFPSRQPQPQAPAAGAPQDQPNPPYVPPQGAPATAPLPSSTFLAPPPPFPYPCPPPPPVRRASTGNIHPAPPRPPIHPTQHPAQQVAQWLIASPHGAGPPAVQPQASTHVPSSSQLGMSLTPNQPVLPGPSRVWGSLGPGPEVCQACRRRGAHCSGYPCSACAARGMRCVTAHSHVGPTRIVERQKRRFAADGAPPSSSPLRMGVLETPPRRQSVPTLHAHGMRRRRSVPTLQLRPRSAHLPHSESQTLEHGAQVTGPPSGVPIMGPHGVIPAPEIAHGAEFIRPPGGMAPPALTPSLAQTGPPTVMVEQLELAALALAPQRATSLPEAQYAALPRSASWPFLPDLPVWAPACEMDVEMLESPKAFEEP